MALEFWNNPFMDINKTIAANLTEWMKENPSLDTVQKVEGRSGVGFGTVRRAKNGEGNITAKNMALIAAAFGRHPAELMIQSAGSMQAPQVALQDYPIEGTATRLEAHSPSAQVVGFKSPALEEINALCRQINETGLREAIGYLKRVAEQHPAAGGASRKRCSVIDLQLWRERIMRAGLPPLNMT